VVLENYKFVLLIISLADSSAEDYGASFYGKFCCNRIIFILLYIIKTMVKIKDAF
jgi:hypothetical protein